MTDATPHVFVGIAMFGSVLGWPAGYSLLHREFRLNRVLYTIGAAFLAVAVAAWWKADFSLATSVTVGFLGGAAVRIAFLVWLGARRLWTRENSHE